MQSSFYLLVTYLLAICASTMEISLDLRTYSNEIHSHEHDFHQLVLPVQGSLQMSVDTREGEASLQQIAVIKAGSEHGFSAQGDNRFVVADVPDFLAPELAQLPAYIGVDEALGHFIQFVASRLQSNQGAGIKDAASERQMLLLLLQLLQERQGIEARADKRIQSACAIIEQGYALPVSVEGLAKQVHLSQRQFTELFRRQTGLSVKQYVIERRMQQAWLLLHTSSESIQTIASAVGYEDQGAFSHRFKSQFGKTPSQVRQSHL